MRSRVVHVCASVVVLLAMAEGSGIVGRWSSRAANESLGISVDRDQAPVRNTIIERIGDLPALIDRDDPWLHLQFIDEDKGWFATGRELWRTEDGGKTWLSLYEAAERRIGVFQFVGPEMGWMIADERMLKTNDGGSTWESFSQPIPPYWEGDLTDFKFLEDGIHGWVAGGVYVPLSAHDDYEGYCPQRYLGGTDMKDCLRGAIFYTDDGGQTWRRQLLAQDWGSLALASLSDPAHFAAVGTAGAYYLRKGKWRPIDDGGRGEDGLTRVKSLDVEIGFPTYEPICVFFLNDQTGWISNSNGYVAKTTDGGKAWQDVCPPIGEKDGRSLCFSRLFFIDEMNGLAFGSYWRTNRNLYVTKDGGKSWLEEKLDIELADILFVDHTMAWASSKAGLFRIKLPALLN